MDYFDRFWVWYTTAPQEEILAWAVGVAFVCVAVYMILSPDPYRNRRNRT